MRPEIKQLSGLYRFGRVVLTPVMYGLSRPHFLGVENIPRSGPFILAPTHVSSFDPVAIAYAMSEGGRQVRFLAKEAVFSYPLVGRFMRTWGMIPVIRDTADSADVLVHARKALQDGDAVGIYFEGTFTRDPAFWPMKGKTGLARLALDLRVPIIPAIQWGTQDVMDRYGKLHVFGRRPNMYIKVLPELDYSDIEGDSENREGVRELTRRLQTTLTQSLADLREEVPPEVPWNMKEMGGPSSKELAKFSKWRRGLSKAARRQDILPATPGAQTLILEVDD